MTRRYQVSEGTTTWQGVDWFVVRDLKKDQVVSRFRTRDEAEYKAGRLNHECVECRAVLPAHEDGCPLAPFVGVPFGGEYDDSESES